MYGEYTGALYEDTPGVQVSKKTKEQIIANCKATKYSYSSEYCGAWIKLNGWKIPDDYPYEF